MRSADGVDGSFNERTGGQLADGFGPLDGGNRAGPRSTLADMPRARAVTTAVAVALSLLTLAACGSSSPSSSPSTTTSSPGNPASVGPSAYVTQSLNNDLAQVSLTSGRIVRTIATPEGPDPIAATADERYLVVANFGDLHVGRTATVVDLVTGRVSVVPTGIQPSGVAVVPGQTNAWVTGNQDGTLTEIDLATAKVVRSFTVGGHLRAIAISPDGTTAYVADMGTFTNPVGHTVYRVDLTSGTITGQVDTGTDPCAMVLVDGVLWVSVDGSPTAQVPGTVLPVTVATMTAQAPITVGFRPAGMAMTSDGTLLFVTNSGNPYTYPDNLGDGDAPASAHQTVSVIDVTSREVTGTIPVGVDPWNIAISPDGTEAWVVNAKSNSLTPIDLFTGRPGAPIPVPGHPHGIALIGLT